LSAVVFGAIVACGSVACGGGGAKPEPKDPSDGNAKPAEDATNATNATKWEGATNPKPEDAQPKAAGKSGAVVHEQPQRRSDQYDKEATEVVLKRSARQVKENCGAAKDEDGKAAGPWGKLTVQVQLGHAGRSKGITVPPPYADKAVGRCIEKAFANLVFPPWGGQDAQVDWELELLQPAAPPPPGK
jgi:hypothetical protein